MTGTFLAVGNLIDSPPFPVFRILINRAKEYSFRILRHLHNDFFKNFKIVLGNPDKNTVHILPDAFGYIILYRKRLLREHEFFIPPVTLQAFTPQISIALQIADKACNRGSLDFQKLL